MWILLGPVLLTLGLGILPSLPLPRSSDQGSSQNTDRQINIVESLKSVQWPFGFWLLTVHRQMPTALAPQGGLFWCYPQGLGASHMGVTKPVFDRLPFSPSQCAKTSLVTKPQTGQFACHCH